ncbi:MAG: UDP-N-acetylmuramoyl-L-alanine--D-glutamate ligase [Anaerolineales bacterium]
MTDWSGKRILILGAARQGMALARWMTRHGAHVTLSDRRLPADLEPARRSLADLPLRWALGGHPVELLDRADVLCLSGGIPLDLPIVVEAVRRGIPLSNDTQVFMEAAPCKTVGITGSAGKTTTTTLVGEMAKRSFENARKSSRAFVGGNIGDPLLNYLDEMTADDLAILEISSFQLEQMTVSPHVAAVLNITPNHLDRHGTMEAYMAAKARILDFQRASDTAILGREDPGAWNLRSRVKGKLLSFGLDDLGADQSGIYARDGLYYLRDGNVELRITDYELRIHLRGEHNRRNVLAAIAIGHAAGLSLDAMLEAVEAFRGVPHRLELVRELRGVKWYNDSIATAPERSMAAVRSFEEPIVLLLGGKDKNLPWDDLAALVQERVDHVVVFGDAAEKILGALGAAGPHSKLGRGEKRPFTIQRCSGLREAVGRAAEVAEAGDVVLLSPGGTSFDEFTDFAERGERFRAWVQELS